MSYYIPPVFLEKLAVHITKNFLDLPNVKAPLILGIHGRKGEGKTFMCELVFKRMGLGTIYMSAGELESPDAGDPARLLRLRYREAGEWSRINGRMAVLMINDVDAGIGRVDSGTQYTVNTQLVNATLMNIADNPTNVQLPGSYDAEPTQRIPIILTGNDFATLYAPLIRDGRMEKFFWDPTRDDRLGIVSGIFEIDGVSRADVETLVDTFPDQATDFFGALRSRLYDEQVRQLIYDVGIEKVSQKVVHSDGKPVEFHKPNFKLAHLIEIGRAMVREQDRIRELRLVEEYNQALRPSAPNEHATSSSAPHARPTQGADSADRYFTYYGSTSESSSVQSSEHRGGNGQAQSGDRPRSTAVAQPPSTLPSELIDAVRTIISQGYRMGIEYVDARRFRTGSWKSFGTYHGDMNEAIADLESCLREHANNYVQLVSIDPNRRRLAERIVHRPG